MERDIGSLKRGWRETVDELVGNVYGWVKNHKGGLARLGVFAVPTVAAFHFLTPLAASPVPAVTAYAAIEWDAGIFKNNKTQVILMTLFILCGMELLAYKAHECTWGGPMDNFESVKKSYAELRKNADDPTFNPGHKFIIPYAGRDYEISVGEKGHDFTAKYMSRTFFTGAPLTKQYYFDPGEMETPRKNFKHKLRTAKPR
jgi:hypothetical protein